MTRVAISGFASLDHVIVLDGAVVPGRTTTITARPRDAWPRLGGGPAYVARALVRGCDATATPLSWVGEDPEGSDYRDRIAAAGVDPSGIARVKGARTPMAVLSYDAAGDCACLYDPGMGAEIGFDATQEALIARADWLCLTIGPRPATEALLRLIRPEQKLAWVVKNDPRVMSDALRAALAERADVIFCNGRERALLGPSSRPGQIVIETMGSSGAVLSRGPDRCSVPTEPLAVPDPTGAGDSFAGGLLAALIRGETALSALGGAGHDAARHLLGSRNTDKTAQEE